MILMVCEAQPNKEVDWRSGSSVFCYCPAVKIDENDIPAAVQAIIYLLYRFVNLALNVVKVLTSPKQLDMLSDAFASVCVHG